MAPVARVAVEKTTCRFDKLFDYAIPQGMPLRPGVRVLVPFGHGRRIGLVVELAEQAAHAALKPIAAPLEEEPVLTEEGLFLLRWLRENTFCISHRTKTESLFAPPVKQGRRPKIYSADLIGQFGGLP